MSLVASVVGTPEWECGIGDPLLMAIQSVYTRNRSLICTASSKSACCGFVSAELCHVSFSEITHIGRLNLLGQHRIAAPRSVIQGCVCFKVSRSFFHSNFSKIGVTLPSLFFDKNHNLISFICSVSFWTWINKKLNQLIMFVRITTMNNESLALFCLQLQPNQVMSGL